MIPSFYTSLSGLNAFQQQLNVAVNNLANVNTDGFKQSQIVLSSAEPQSVVAASKKLELHGPLALEQSADGVSVVEKLNVDVSQEMTGLITAKRAYQANLKALKAADETVESLLDIVGR